MTVLWIFEISNKAFSGITSFESHLKFCFTENKEIWSSFDSSRFFSTNIFENFSKSISWKKSSNSLFSFISLSQIEDVNIPLGFKLNKLLFISISEKLSLSEEIFSAISKLASLFESSSCSLFSKI